MKRGPYKKEFPPCVQKCVAALYHYTDLGYGGVGDYFGGLSKARVQRIVRAFPRDDAEVRRLARVWGLSGESRLRRELVLLREG